LSINAHGQNSNEIRLEGEAGKGSVGGFGGQLGYFDGGGGILRVEVEEYPVLGADSDVAWGYGQLCHHLQVLAAHHGLHVCKERLLGELAPETQSGYREVDDGCHEEDQRHYGHWYDVLYQDGLD
jgi:hypothetical protein